MALLHHFVIHYTAMGIPPAHFLILVHVRGPGGQQAAREATDRLQRAYGIRYTRALLEEGDRDSPGAFLKAVWSMFAEYVALQDWVLHMELDEFVAFPQDEGFSLMGLPPAHGPASLFDVHRFFDIRESQGHNIVYGYVVDRLARVGMPDVVSGQFGQTIFEQFPLNCYLTYGVRKADVRRAVAYKGYLRADLGHHIAIGVSRDWYDNVVGPTPHELRRLLQRGLSSEVWSLLPYSGTGSNAPVLKFWRRFATVYHFKWHAGLVQKMRRTHNRGWYPAHAHTTARLMSDIFELERKRSYRRRSILNEFCINTSGEAKRALRAGELVRAITNMSEDEWRSALDLQRLEGQDMAFWEDETWSYTLYDVFMFQFDYNISNFIDMMSKVR